MLLNLRELQAFLAVVDHGSLGKAAEALHLSQPALSRIIHRLESQVGVPLLDRHQRGATMTEYGSELERYARLLLSESARAVQGLEAMRGMEKGVVRFGAVTSALSSFVPATVEHFLSRSPGVQAVVVEGLTEELLSQLARGDIDLGLTFEVPTSDDIEVVSQSEWQEGCYIVAGETHPLLGRKDLVLKDLLGERWALVPRGMQPREQLRHVFTAQGLVPPPAAVESGSIALLRQLVARGGFLGWMPRPLIEHGDNSHGPIRILPVQGVQTTRRYALYRRRESALSPATRSLLADLLAAIRALQR
jgi:DNA-binding transcriptional LysR family regulator